MLLLGAAFCTAMIFQVAADEKVKQPETEFSKLELMRHLINSWSIRTKEERTEPLAFVQEPVMQYHDPKYKLTECAIWRLGQKGRPRAYVVVEMDHPTGTAGRATYEFLAISEGPFRISGSGVSWQPWELAVDFKPFADGPEPAKTALQRLEQMQQIAIRFSAEEMLGREKISLNLHPEPFDRYQPTEAKNSDAAVFVLERGFNPEVILLLETDSKTWSYACARLSAAATVVKLDKKEVWSNPKISSRPKAGQIGYHWTNGYTAGRLAFYLPKKLIKKPVTPKPVQAIPAKAKLPKIKKQPK